MKKEFYLDLDVADCTYHTVGTIGVDIFKLYQTKNGQKQLEKLLKSIEDGIRIVD